MSETYEYTKDRSTWRFHRPPEFPYWFQEKLNTIAGMNRHGKPNLRLVWGGTCKSEKSADKGRLKYLCGLSPQDLKGYQYLDNGEWKFVDDLAKAPEGAMVAPVAEREQLGLLRWIIEVWVSPEELERSQRFKKQYLPGELKPVLRSFPREGVYDCFLIIENLQEKYRPVGHDVLQVVQAMWKDRQRPYHERLADEMKFEDLENEQEEKREAELDRAMWQGDLKLDKEEKERRDWYWKTKHDYSDRTGTHM